MPIFNQRYTVVIAERSEGALYRFTVKLHSAVVLLIAIIGTPILLGVGYRWTASTEIENLRTSLATLEIENSGFRQATRKLASEVASLHTVLADIDERAILDVASLRAMEALPAALKVRVVGGGPGPETGPSNPLYSAALIAPHSTFNLLDNLLGDLRGRLDSISHGIDQRAALADATPSIWPTNGWVSSVFGYRKDPFTGGRVFHRAMDISAQHGRPVLATALGKVESARRNGKLGNLIVIRHGFGITTRYGHLTRFAVRPGTQVQRGDVIGYVGSTGRSTGSHLHYEVWADGRPLNPSQFLMPVATLSTN
jgi:murein DD-endopeptidase MepM/ murein hydrolase activator NlpD